MRMLRRGTKYREERVSGFGGLGVSGSLQVFWAFIAAALAALALFALSVVDDDPAASAASKKERPNILLIETDDQTVESRHADLAYAETRDGLAARLQSLRDCAGESCR